MKKYKHYVLTKFNIKVNFRCKLRNPEKNPMELILDENYLENRFYIFENYTLISMKEQTNQNFTWIVLFHKKTPQKFLKKIAELKKVYNFIDLYLDDDETFELSKYIDEKEKVTEIITSRIDNDDMYSNEYIEKIQEYADTAMMNTCILSFEEGAKYDLDKKHYTNLKDATTIFCQ